MGLRIIGRRSNMPPLELSEADLLAGLAAHSRSWPESLGFASAEAQRALVAKVRSVKTRLTTAADVTACAKRVREHLTQHQQDGTAAHAPVDVATLLELL